jgi:two-component system LytT family sensor kinase
MENPFLKKKQYLLVYILVWIILAIVQMSIEHLIFDQDLEIVGTASFIICFFHVVYGLIIWFPVRFNPLNNNKIINSITNIFATGTTALAVWVLLPYIILKSIFPLNNEFLGYFDYSFAARIIIEFLFFIILILIYYVVIYSENLREKISNETRLKMLVRDAELNILKSQINPHFLFNALNSISFLIKKAPDSAREMVIKLSEFLRYSLKYKENDMTSLEEELDNVDRYLVIEKVRFGDKLIYQKEVDNELLKILVPNMIFQPLIENALKHGVYESTSPIHIFLIASRKNDFLEVKIKNDFDPKSKTKKGAGIGLKNIKERLALIYSNQSSLNVLAEKSKFEVILKIPV